MGSDLVGKQTGSAHTAHNTAERGRTDSPVNGLSMGTEKEEGQSSCISQGLSKETADPHSHLINVYLYIIHRYMYYYVLYILGR